MAFQFNKYAQLQPFGFDRIQSVYDQHIHIFKIGSKLVDLLGHQDEPAARQLLHSLLSYLDSPAFAPDTELDRALLEKLLPK